MKLKLLNLHMGNHNPAFNHALAKSFDCIHMNWLVYGRNSAALQNEICHRAKIFKPDYIFLHIQDGDVLTTKTILQLSKKSKVINWTGDVLHPLPQHYIDNGKHIFLTLFSNETDVDNARKQGIKADYLQVGFDDNMFTPNGDTNSFFQPILFLGSNYNSTANYPLSYYREEMVNRVKEEYGSMFGLYGLGWDFAQGNLTDYNTEGAAYRTCKIAINLSHFEYKRYSSDRIFRIMGSGAFCLSHRYPDMEKDFEIGEDLVVWEDIDDLIAKINYYLQNDDERTRIAANGCAKVRANFTWFNFTENLKQIIKKYE